MVSFDFSIKQIDINWDFMFGKIAVRNIPNEVWERLEILAKAHDRSTEAEARYALRSWVAPSIRDDNRSARRTEVATRLTDLLEHVNKAIHGSEIRPSHIAEEIGESHAEETENWFAGTSEPSFKQLDKVASYLGGVRIWLQHGDRQMFPAESMRLPENAVEAAKWMFDIGEAERPTKIMFVREVAEAGSLVVVKQYGRWRCSSYLTGMNVSEVIGAGGEAALAHFSILLELMYKYYTTAGENNTNIVIKSYQLSPDKFRLLYEGKEHPLILLRNIPDQPWWEDFWDVDMFRKQEYWPGWKSLCERIYRVVELKAYLQEERTLIRAGHHVFLKEKNKLPYESVE